MAALQRNFELDHPRVHINVDNGRVTLGRRFMISERCTKHTGLPVLPGVRDVVNLLKVYRRLHNHGMGNKSANYSGYKDDEYRCDSGSGRNGWKYWK